MMHLLPLHRLAASRGDGLHPALRDVLEQRMSALAAPETIVDIAAYRGSGEVQAGPHPRGTAGDALPTGVLRFAPRLAPDAQAPRRLQPTSKG